jgi:hypothetical protein
MIDIRRKIIFVLFAFVFFRLMNVEIFRIDNFLFVYMPLLIIFSIQVINI